MIKDKAGDVQEVLEMCERQSPIGGSWHKVNVIKHVEFEEYQVLLRTSGY